MILQEKQGVRHLTDPPEGRLRFELHYSGGQPERFVFKSHFA